MIARLMVVGGMLLCGTASAQDSGNAELEEVIVTGSRVSGYGTMPAVTLARTADFLVQNIRLVNDSRAPNLRRQEIVRTIADLMRLAERSSNIELSYGKGFLVPIDLTDESLELIEDEDRTDTSYVDIYVKVKFDPRQDAREQIGTLRKFIEASPNAGRTELEPQGDIGLSIISPERYRYDIIRAIAAETRRLADAAGRSCKVSLGGLEGRVQWQRTSVSELTLFIPYEVKVSDCTG